MEYNGWTNYATWAVKLWIDNEEGSYHAVRETAREIWEAAADDDPDGTPHSLQRTERAARDLARELEGIVRDLFDLPVEGLAGDLCGSALSDVNWEEIAESIVEDIAEENE